ncbi:hypothetical protein N806_20415 [Rhodococcus sp. P27]|nr:hypothetical protein N806_12145 [Rhodococcus sp. P27]ERB53401.1 hypothetical protein N806_20415 [Rhodococcus sp. P27]
MSDRTGIEWTDATWNPVTGCTKVSPGCDNCYAETFSERFRGTPGHYFEGGFDIQLRPDKLDQPLRWTRARRVFVNSMSDLFHTDVPTDFIDQVFGVMAANLVHDRPTHTFQLLTKRHGRMRSYLSDPDVRARIALAAAQFTDDRRSDSCHDYLMQGNCWPLPNVWLGVSTEDQKWADIRIPALLETPAAVRFISAEPLLGPIDLAEVGAPPFWCLGHGRPAAECPNDLHLPRRGIDWVIVGGESGRNARPMHPEWATSLRDQCVTAEVPFLFKQWGEWTPIGPDEVGRDTVYLDAANGKGTHYAHRYRPGVNQMTRVGKKATGRELDGRTWDGYPGDAT